jgi:hypothetical protein
MNELDCLHFRAYKWSCVNDGKCKNQRSDDTGHKYCITRGKMDIQTSINAYREAIVRAKG